MKIATKYNRIERVVYEFDTADIKHALMEYAKLRYEEGKRIDFDVQENDNGGFSATIVVVYEYPEGAPRGLPMTIEITTQDGATMFRICPTDPLTIERKPNKPGARFTFYMRRDSANEAKAALLQLGKGDG